jgi:hypothetical protein
MKSGFDHLQDLEQQIHAMSRTESPAELFKVLRDACRLSAPRGSVFLVRQGKIQGWAAFGYEAEAIGAQRDFNCGLGEGWLGALATATEKHSASRPEGDSGPDFGQPHAAECVGSVIRIQGKPIAILVAERDADESPWHPEVNRLLVNMAQLRLELDLALRKMQGATQPAAKAELPSEPTPVPVKTAPVEVTEVAPLPEETDQEKPELEAARRYARLVATDIRLYNEEAVVLGRRNGDLDRRLEEHLDRGKETFLRRHSDLGPTGLDLLFDAYVQVLAAGDDKLIPPSVRS